MVKETVLEGLNKGDKCFVTARVKYVYFEVVVDNVGSVFKISKEELKGLVE